MFTSHTKSTLAIILGLCATTMLPVCSEMEVWSDGTNYRYLIKDCHIDYIDGRVSIKQHNDIINAALAKKSQKAFIIAEDTADYTGNKKTQSLGSKTIEEDFAIIQAAENIDPIQAKNSMQIIQSSVTPLACLINTAKKSGIPHYNAENNQVLNIYQWQWRILPNEKISQEDVINDLSEHIAEIKNTKELDEDYQDLLEQLNQLKKSSSENEDNDFIEKATVIRNNLLEVKTFHKLIEWKHIKHGFVCEGKEHIENIKDALEGLGYTQTKRFGDFSQYNTTCHMEQKEQEEIYSLILKNALNLKEIFECIFAAQKNADITTMLDLSKPLPPIMKKPIITSVLKPKRTAQDNFEDKQAAPKKQKIESEK